MSLFVRTCESPQNPSNYTKLLEVVTKPHCLPTGQGCSVENRGGSLVAAEDRQQPERVRRRQPHVALHVQS